MGVQPGDMLGPYRIEERVGRGGMATVYRATDTNLNRIVAIKIISAQLSEDPQFVARFKREAQAVASLDHPNIVPIYAFGDDRDHDVIYLVTRFIAGGTLSEMISRQPRPPLTETLSLIEQIGTALGYAHGLGIVHRDVKPANVLIDPPDTHAGRQKSRYYLADFGIAKIMESSENLTGTGVGIGTPEYMSPEQALGEQIDGRSDIYSLGIMLYQMVTGQVPFTSKTPVAILQMQITQPIPPARQFNPEVTPVLDDLIRQATAKRPSDRFNNTDSFLQALRQAAGGMNAGNYATHYNANPAGPPLTPGGGTQFPPDKAEGATIVNRQGPVTPSGNLSGGNTPPGSWNAGQQNTPPPGNRPQNNPIYNNPASVWTPQQGLPQVPPRTQFPPPIQPGSGQVNYPQTGYGTAPGYGINTAPRKSRIWLWVFLCVLALIFLACAGCIVLSLLNPGSISTTTNLQNTQTAQTNLQSTQTVETSVTATALSAKEETGANFTDGCSNWPTKSTAGITLGCGGGTYSIAFTFTNQSEFFYYKYLRFQPTDLSIEATFEPVSLPQGSYYGIIARATTNDQLVLYALSDGTIDLSHYNVRTQAYDLLSQKKNAFANSEGTKHTLRLTVTGQDVTVFLDGNQVIKGTYTLLQSGGAGLTVGNPTTVKITDIHIINLD